MATLRQAAGTRTLTDLLRGRFFGSSHADLDALDHGASLAISGYELTDGGRTQGRLVVVTQPRTTIAWQPWAALKGHGPSTELPAPYAWVSEDGRPVGMKGMFRQVTFTAGGQVHRIGIPVKDIPTLQAVVTESAGETD